MAGVQDQDQRARKEGKGRGDTEGRRREITEKEILGKNAMCVIKFTEYIVSSSSLSVNFRTPPNLT